jgi:hypothetical protein
VGGTCFSNSLVKEDQLALLMRELPGALIKSRSPRLYNILIERHTKFFGDYPKKVQMD